MDTNIISTIPERAGGWTHQLKVRYSDFSTAGLTQTIQLLGTGNTGCRVGDIVRNAAIYLPTPFVSSGAMTSLKIDVGWDLAAGTDDPDGLIAAYELLGAATEILAADANGAAFATLRNGFAFQENGDIEAVFTALGANVNTLTAGEVWVFLNISRLWQVG
jgi:hypothetical protein